jgi:coenzyme PQQ precursor peptide PqqA
VDSVPPGAGEYGAVKTLKESHMKWETPVAIDLRFGMEITMYIANR